MIRVYADGACKGNPGPGGWGVLILTEDGEVELFGGERATTNNRMELTAAIKAIEALPEGTTAELWTDSQYVQKGISEWIKGWKRNGWRTACKTPVKNAELWMLLDELSSKRVIKWNWVKGHAGHEHNERVDGLANRGVDTVRR